MSERGDGGRTTTTQRRESSNTHDGGTRTANMEDMSVTPVVQDVTRSASLAEPTSASRPAPSRLVYVTPPRVNESPTATPGQSTVTPLGANPNNCRGPRNIIQ